MNPVAFTIFGKPIYWYGIVIALGVALGVWIAMRETKRRRINSDAIIDLMLWCIPLAIIGARLYYVAFSWDAYKDQWYKIFYIWEGGIAIYGAILGGLLGVYLYSRRSKSSFVEWTDILLPSVVLGQALGRWGNFFNQEAFGPVVTNPTWQWFPASVYIDRLQEWHMATFFYESFWCLLVFVFLMLYRRKNPPKGAISLWYVTLYGLERAVVEGLRTDSLYIGSLRVSQILSILMVIGGTVGLILVYRRRKLAAEGPDESLRLMRDRDDDAEPAPPSPIEDEPDVAEATAEEAAAAEEAAEAPEEEEDEAAPQEELRADAEQEEAESLDAIAGEEPVAGEDGADDPDRNN